MSDWDDDDTADDTTTGQTDDTGPQDEGDTAGDTGDGATADDTGRGRWPVWVAGGVIGVGAIGWVSGNVPGGVAGLAAYGPSLFWTVVAAGSLWAAVRLLVPAVMDLRKLWGMVRAGPHTSGGPDVSLSPVRG